MIDRKELEEYAKIRGLNLGQAEKDYLQTIMLFILYQKYGRELFLREAQL
jgi:predicted nucleotidyltransferase component of viral defense system